MKLAATILIIIALAISLGAAPADSQPAAPPVFSSEVSLVLLPVFVIDREGRAVRGLTADDFEIQEDGRRVAPAAFRYVDTTASEDQADLRQASAARRRFLLVFDKSFTDIGGLSRAQRAAAQFVRRRLAPSDLAAVATFDVQQGFRLLANFTEDRALLVHAVRTLGVPSFARVTDPLALAADLQLTDVSTTSRAEFDETQTAGGVLNSVLAVLARRLRAAEDELYKDQVLGLVAGFEELAKALRSVDGRKQVLYFSAGFDSRLLTGEQGSDQRNSAQAVAEGRLWEVDGTARFGDNRLRERMREMTRGLARSDAVLHAIDVTGLGTDRSLTQIGVTQDARRENPGREALSFLAAETGGRFFQNANDLEPALAEMLEMTSRYYVLGFQPEQVKGPGAFHRVRVKVKRKAVKVSHRVGYYERAPAPQRALLQRQFEAAQLLMTGAADELAFSSLCLPFPVPEGPQRLGVVVQVPRRSLAWAPGQPLSLEVYAYLVDGEGIAHDHLGKLARWDPAAADPHDKAHGVSFQGSLRAAPGQYTLRLLVRDPDTGSAGVQLMDVTVPPYDANAGFLLPPVVVDEAGRWLSVDMSGAGGAREPLAFPFRIGERPFLPRASFEMRGGEPQRLLLFAYEPARAGDPAADLQISSTLTDRGGRSLRPGVLKIDSVRRDEPGRRTYLLGYTPERLAEGDYTLRIGVGEADSQVESYSLIRIRPGS
jgi:VWFA-related protein